MKNGFIAMIVYVLFGGFTLHAIAADTHELHHAATPQA